MELITKKQGGVLFHGPEINGTDGKQKQKSTFDDEFPKKMSVVGEMGSSPSGEAKECGVEFLIQRYFYQVRIITRGGTSRKIFLLGFRISFFHWALEYSALWEPLAAKNA